MGPDTRHRNAGDAVASSTRSNAGDARNPRAPRGLRRRRLVCCVVAPQRCHRHRLRRERLASEPAALATRPRGPAAQTPRRNLSSALAGIGEVDRSSGPSWVYYDDKDKERMGWKMDDATNHTKNESSGQRATGKLESITNVAVLVAAVLVAVYFAFMFFGRFRPDDQVPRAAAGLHLSLPTAYNFSAHEKTLILAIQEGCRFCEDSMPFYGKLTNQLSSGCVDAGVVAVLPNPEPTADALLARFGLEIPRLADTSLASLGVNGTPTLLLVDREGVVSNVWVGKLSSEGESQVLSTIDPNSTCD